MPHLVAGLLFIQRKACLLEPTKFTNYRLSHCDDVEGDIMIDEKKLQQFVGKMIGDLGAAISVPLVRIGVRLGLYKAMDGAGPMSSAEFATKANGWRKTLLLAI